MEQYMAAVEHAVESTVEQRFLVAVHALTDLWSFATDKSKDPTSAEAEEPYAARLEQLCTDVAVGVADLIGDKQSTYLHGIRYGWPRLGRMFGLLLRTSMEGFEHANKIWGGILAHRVSKGGRAGRKSAYQAALECRRSGTTALQEIGKVNHCSTVVAGEEHERKIDCQKALQALREQLSVLREVDPCEECEPCTEEDTVPYKE